MLLTTMYFYFTPDSTVAGELKAQFTFVANNFVPVSDVPYIIVKGQFYINYGQCGAVPRVASAWQMKPARFIKEAKVQTKMERWDKKLESRRAFSFQKFSDFVVLILFLKCSQFIFIFLYFFYFICFYFYLFFLFYSFIFSLFFALFGGTVCDRAGNSF